jgi:hypothetical protein
MKLHCPPHDEPSSPGASSDKEEGSPGGRGHPRATAAKCGSRTGCHDSFPPANDGAQADAQVFASRAAAGDVIPQRRRPVASTESAVPEVFAEFRKVRAEATKPEPARVSVASHPSESPGGRDASKHCHPFS